MEGPLSPSARLPALPWSSLLWLGRWAAVAQSWGCPAAVGRAGLLSAAHLSFVRSFFFFSSFFSFSFEGTVFLAGQKSELL